MAEAARNFFRRDGRVFLKEALQGLRLAAGPSGGHPELHPVAFIARIENGLVAAIGGPRGFRRRFFSSLFVLLSFYFLIRRALCVTLCDRLSAILCDKLIHGLLGRRRSDSV